MPTLKKIFTALVCMLFVVTYSAPDVVWAQAAAPAAGAAADQAAVVIPDDQLDSLVAPIALYPDPLLSQVLVASTYPLEIIQLQQYLEKNPTLKGKALTDAVEKQDWDPSIQAMAVLPDAVKQLSDNIQWTQDLGNAFLAQQSGVMDAVQRMRKKAEGTGALKTTEQQTVQTQTIENKQVIVVQPASPDIVYVPSYNPVVVYGPPVYAYPPIYYPPPPSTGAIVAASMISFGVGMAIGAAWGGGGWGYGCGWGSSNINVNVNNTFVRNSNINRNTNIGGNGGNWQHNPAHRGGAPYADQRTANRFGGTTDRSSLSNRQANARQQLGQGGSRPGAGGAGTRQGQLGQGASTRPAGGGQGASRPGGGGAGTARAGQTGLGGGGGAGSANRVGDRSIPSGSGMNHSSALGGGAGGGFNGASARANSARGAGSINLPSWRRGRREGRRKEEMSKL